MFKNICCGFAVAVIAASFAGCGGGDVTTDMPSEPPTLSSEMQDFKAQVLKHQQEQVAHQSGSAMGRFGKARHR